MKLPRRSLNFHAEPIIRFFNVVELSLENDKQPYELFESSYNW